MIQSSPQSMLPCRLLGYAGVLLGFTLIPLAGSFAASRSVSGTLTFEKDVRPILKAHCFQCHGEGGKLKGGLDVRLARFLLKGGETGPAITPGKSKGSLLLDLVKSGEMPKAERKLTAAEVEIISRWIAQGAKTLRPEPENLDGFHITEEERSFWAFQPLARPAVPKLRGSNELVRNPIDAFVLDKLKQSKLTFSAEADRATLIRRATFDLTGLPPKPEDVRAFVEDKSPDAYERLLDRLLASPHYGERWGRHWLDVAGYADSDGFTEADPVRKYAYKYRDYVIRSLNEDKSFDQFIREQLAGDDLVRPPYKNLSPEAVDKLIATGFLRMAPDGTSSGGVDQKIARNQVLTDTIKIVSSSLLGMTVGCAQCHDHRHDPISQEDYYRMRAVFEPALDPANWRAPNARLISLMTDAERAEAARLDGEAALIGKIWEKKKDEFIDLILGKELAKLPETVRAPLWDAFHLPANKRSPEQVKLLKDHPSVSGLNNGSLYLYDQKLADELKRISDEADAIRARKPVEEFIAPLTEIANAKVPVTQLFHRGDPDQPKQTVKPGELTVLASLRSIEIPEKKTDLPTTGRRLELAQHLTDGSHPLTTRVLVNRIWMHHFGRGLVATPSDFGRFGARPSHPELLDWLATEFVSQGWSLKNFHRLIMTSQAYRQSSLVHPKGERADPDNRLLWRMNVRRLEAETLRDAVLAVSGKLNTKLFGAPVPIMEDESGQVVVGIDTNDTAGRPSGKFVGLKGEEFRRSLYIQVRRSKPVGMLETFDAPLMEPNCELRNVSTVAPQSLALMNGEFAVAQSLHFANRLASESSDLNRQINHAWELTFGVLPNPSQSRDAMEFLQRQTALFKAEPPKLPPPPGEKTAPKIEPERLALATYCQALLASNRFLYID